MAYHYLVNARTGETKTIRSESLPSYTGHSHWKIFDTVAARDAAAPQPSYAANFQQGIVQRIMPYQVGEYDAAWAIDEGWKVYPSHAEATAALAANPRRYVCDAYTGLVTIAMTWRKGWKLPPSQTLHNSESEARAALPPALFAVDVCTGSIGRCYPAARSREERNGRRVVATEAEALALIPIRFAYSEAERRYVRMRQGGSLTMPSLYAMNHGLVLAMSDNREQYSTYDGRTRGTRTQFDVLANAFILDHMRRRVGTISRAAALAQFVSRMNAMLAKKEDAPGDAFTVALCVECENQPVYDGHEEYNDGHICSSCAANLSHCSSCGCIIPDGEGRENDSGDVYCPEHYNRPREPEAGRMLSYSTDVTKRRDGFLHGTREAKPALWLGWELECHAGEDYTREDAVAAVQKSVANGWAIVKEDGSLANGMEIVSVPASLAWHRENVAPWLVSMKGKLSGWQHSDCGIHVHVGKKELSEYTLGKLLVFMHEAENQGFINKVAGRNPGQYCNRGGTKKTIPDYRHEADRGRYQALNFATRGQKTVEFRIFRSNVSAQGFMKNLDFVAALCMWCRDASPNEVAQVQAGLKGKGDVPGNKNFIAYVARNRGSYPALVRWLEDQSFLPKPSPIPAKYQTTETRNAIVASA